MKVEFYRPDDEERTVVAEVTWIDGGVQVHTDDDEVATGLRHAFRRTPIVTDDASFRRLGTHGVVVLQPGDLEWFRAAALSRATEETGLAATVVPGITGGGFDPAANYRRFGEQIEWLTVGRRRPETDLTP